MRSTATQESAARFRARVIAGVRGQNLSASTLFTASGIFGVAAIVLYALAVHRIRRNHPKLYAQLDNPDYLYSDPVPQSLRDGPLYQPTAADRYRNLKPHYGSLLFSRYLFRCEFMNEGDGLLALIGTCWYLSWVLTVVTMIWGWT